MTFQHACRFGAWTDAQCKVEECVEAHTNVDIIVDIPQLKLLLDSRLPLVFAGASVKAASAIWPPSTPQETQPWELPPGAQLTKPTPPPASKPTSPPDKPKRRMHLMGSD